MEATLFYTDAKVSEYLLVIIPPAKIAGEVEAYKKKLAERIGIYKGLYAQSHIMLTNFLLSPARTDAVLMYFEHFFRSMHSFSLSLKNFGRFGTHTVFVKPVKNREILVNMQHTTYKLLRYNMGLKTSVAGKLSHPHLTIARQLTPGQYQAAWAYLKQAGYDARFKVDKIVLIKRNNLSQYKVFKEFVLA